MCLATPGGGRQAGLRLIQAPCHGGASQRFVAVSSDGAASGALVLRNRASGLCVAASPKPAGGADRIVQQTCSEHSSQRWLVVAAAAPP